MRSRKHGRVRTWELAPRAITLAEDWILRRRMLWQRRLDQLDAHLMTLKQPKR